MRLKRVFAILMSMMLVMGLTPSTVWAEEVHSHALGEDGTVIEFTECSEITNYTIEEDVSYYLTDDIILTESITITNNATVNLCLNGHTITQSTANSIFGITSGATLNLCDCSADGESVLTTNADITTDTKTGIYVDGKFNMYGGTISGFTESGVKVCENAHFCIYDGKISGNSTSHMYGGGGVYLEGGSFDMYGGEISCNTSTTDGGGVTIGGNVSFKMYGGIIRDNTAKNGGAVFLQGTTNSFYGKFTMCDGEIYGNQATNGGAVCCSDYTQFEMENGIIYGNQATEGSAVYIFGNGNGKVSFAGGSVVGNNVLNTDSGVVFAQSGNAAKITIAGAAVQIIDNYCNGSYDESTGKYTGSQVANLYNGMQVVVSAQLDPKNTKIGTSFNYIEEIFAYPDGENITSLAEMEACFVLDIPGYLVCNEDGELIFLVDLFEHHPTLSEPYVELYPGLEADYQWYEITYQKQQELTDQNAYAIAGEGGESSSYDSENGWSGYGIALEQGYYEYFTVPMEAGQTLIVDVDGSVIGELGFVNNEIMKAIVLQPNETNTYAFTVESAGDYVFAMIGATADTTVKAYLGSVPENSLPEETANRLQKAEIGKFYYCKVTLPTGTQATSGAMFYSYYITHQPTAGEPWIELNESEGAIYQWYKVLVDKDEITDKTAEAYSDGEYSAEYSEETGWTAVDGWYFILELEEDEELSIEIADDEELYFGIYNMYENEYDEVEVTGTGTYTLTAPVSGTYGFFSNTGVGLKAYKVTKVVGDALESENGNRMQNPVLGESYCCQITTPAGEVITSDVFTNQYAITHQPIEEEPFVRVNDDTGVTYQWYWCDDVDISIEGQTTDTLTTETPGTYYCKVTFADGTTEMSKLLLVHDWENGACTICKKICTHENYKDGICKLCGIVCTHNWGQYVSDNNATCEKDGTKTKICAICNMKDTITDERSAKGHKYTNYKSDNNATCTADGTKTATCDNGCGTKNTIADTGSKKTHVDANKDGKCDIGGETLSVPVQKITYKIVFNGNGATSGSMKAISNCVADTEYKLTANAFKKKGYTFNGWNTKKDGSGKSYKNKASIENLSSKDGATVTLYAQWKKTKYKITYKLNGGKNSKSNKASYYYTTKTFKLKNPTRKGYTFKGWYTDKKCTKKISQIKKGTAKNYTLYAKWAKKKYTITYVLNKGKNNKNNKKSYYVTTKTFKLKNPTRKGYTFKGWYSDKKCTKKVTKITKGTAKNIKLYAKWVKKK